MVSNTFAGYLSATSLLLIAGCGGGGGNSTPPRSYTVGGTTAGLQGTGLVLLDNGGSNLSVPSTSSTFTFTAPVASGDPFSVTVMTQPGNPSQTCTVANASGIVTGNNITNVAVTCATNTYKIGGTVSGLTGSGLVLANGTDTRSVTSDGAFTFPTPVASGDKYAVTVSTQPTNPSQNCMLGNASGTVAAGDVTDVRVVCTTNVFNVGGGVAGLSGSGLVLSLNGSTQLPIPRSGQFAFPTPIQSGAQYSVAITAQPANPAQACTLANPSGTVTNAPIYSIAVICPNPVGRYAYVTNLGTCSGDICSDGTVSAYSINPASGAFSPVGGPVAAAIQPGSSITVDSLGRFLYVGNGGDLQTNASLSAYRVDSATGALTPFAGNPLVVSGGAPVLTVGPDGRFAYLVTTDKDTVGGGVVQYSIDAQTGGLTQIGQAFFLQDFFTTLVIDPSGRYAYSTVWDGGFIYPRGGGPFAVSLPINAGTGALAVGQLTSIQSPGSAAMDPTGRFFYVAISSTQIAGFLIDPTTGGLTPLAGSPFSLGANTAAGSIAIAIHPNGALLYASQAQANIVGIYAIDPGTGAITAAAAGPLVITNPAPPTFDPSGQFAYVSAASGNPLLGFSVNTSTGALRAMNGTLAVGANPSAVAILR